MTILILGELTLILADNVLQLNHAVMAGGGGGGGGSNYKSRISIYIFISLLACV